LFNRFPTWFLITNIIIVPLSSVLIIIGCIIPVIYPIKFISFPLAKILGFLTGVTAWLTEKASSLPLSTIENIGMSSIESFLLFISVFLIFRYILDRKSISVLYPMISMLLFALSGTSEDIITCSSNELIVYNSIGSSAIGIRSGKTLFLYTDTTAGIPEIVRHSASLGLRIEFASIENGFRNIKAGGKSILISNHLSNRLLREANPDVVVLTGRFPEIERSLKVARPVSSFIVAPNVKESNYLKRTINNQVAYQVHFVKKSGAWKMKL
jgi:competence protein ComEC